MTRSDARLVALVIWVCTGIIVYCAAIFLHFKIWVYHPDPVGYPKVGQSWYGKCLFSLLVASVPALVGYAAAGRRGTDLSEGSVKKLTWLMAGVVVLGALYTTQHEIMRWMVG
jgi:hypothetical protein